MLTIEHPLFKKAGFLNGKVALDAILRRPHVKQADFLREALQDRLNQTVLGGAIGTGAGALVGAGLGAAAHHLVPQQDTRNIFQRAVRREQPRPSLLGSVLSGAAAGGALGGAAGTFVGTGRDRDQRQATQSQIAGQRSQMARQAQLFGSQAQDWGQRLDMKRGRANQMEHIARQQAAARMHQQRQMHHLVGVLRQRQTAQPQMMQPQGQMMQPQGQMMQPRGQMMGGPSSPLIQMYNWRL